MNHLTAKIIIIYKTIELIADKYKLTLSEARDELYKSNVINLIDDDGTGLYGESPLYVLSLFEKEHKKSSRT